MDLSTKDELWWGADISLSSWIGYQSRLGPYGSIDKQFPSDGTVRLIFAPEGRGLEPLSQQEHALIAWFERNEPLVSQAVKTAIIDWCSPGNTHRKANFDFDDNEFPKIESESILRQQIGLHTIHVHQTLNGEVPYLGYEFGCQWEEEHGLGVLMHGTRLVEVGFADAAFLLWMAEGDAAK